MFLHPCVIPQDIVEYQALTVSHIKL